MSNVNRTAQRNKNAPLKNRKPGRPKSVSLNDELKASGRKPTSTYRRIDRELAELGIEPFGLVAQTGMDCLEIAKDARKSTIKNGKVRVPENSADYALEQWIKDQLSLSIRCFESIFPYLRPKLVDKKIEKNVNHQHSVKTAVDEVEKRIKDITQAVNETAKIDQSPGQPH